MFASEHPLRHWKRYKRKCQQQLYPPNEGLNYYPILKRQTFARVPKLDPVNSSA